MFRMMLFCVYEWLQRRQNMIMWIYITLFISLFDVQLGYVEAGTCRSCNELTTKELKPLFFSKDDPLKQLYYRYLMIDEASNSLYVGAMNYVFKLDLANITHNGLSKYLPATERRKSICELQGRKMVPDCQNHIKFIARNHSSVQTDQLYVCGTGAHDPIGYYLSTDNLQKTGDVLGKGVCPNNPSDNSTAVYVESGNPGKGNVSALYSGTIGDFRNVDILRPKLYNQDGTEASGYMQSVDIIAWLYDPQFVGSFDVGDKVIFFLREIALEYYHYEKKIVSRVAKVCKKDKGGYSLLQNKWTSYQKARLNCSIPGKFPDYFDEIQDIVAVDGNTFYGLFTNNINGLSASAICAYTLEDIEKSFDGLFKEQKDENSYWQAVPKSEEPSIRPGNCSIEDSLSLSDDVLSFIRLRPLMDEAVMHKYKMPIFYQGGVQLTRLAVIPKVNNDSKNLIFFTSSNAGDVYKIFTRMDESNMFKTTISSKYSVFDSPRPIWSLKLHKNNLYLGTDEEVVQLNVVTCDTYTKVDTCANDPQCAWFNITDKCVPYTEMTPGSKYYITYHNIDTYEDNTSDTLYQKKEFMRNLSSSVTFDINYSLCTSDRNIKWTFQSNQGALEREVTLDPKHQLTPENSLIITKIDSSDEGTYMARDSENKVVSEYELVVLKNLEDVERAWLDKFEEWSDMFQEQKRLIADYEKSCVAP